jgi:hypothetical protein
MRTRVLLVAAAAVTLGLTLTSANAAPPTLDGKKVKTVTLTAVGPQQDHDSDFVTGFAGGPARVDCTAPRCARKDFIYKPAKGVKGDVMFEAKWTLPAADIDLYVAEVAKDGSPSELAHCGAAAGTSEKIFVDSSSLKSGKRYAIILDFYRTANESVTATATMPGTNSTKTTAPAAVDSNQPVNCGL